MRAHRLSCPESFTNRVLLLALVCCYPLSLVVPSSWAWENGIIEDGDVFVLGAGLAWALWTWLRARSTPAGFVGRCVVPIWAMLIGRELSWGAVLFAPSLMTPEGPVFTSHDLWYRPFVTPVLLALFAWSAWTAWRCRLDRQIHTVLARGRFPWPALLVVLASALGSSCAESHLAAGVPALQNQRFEELVELVGYVALVVVQARVLRACRAGARDAATATMVPAR